jgi:sigma-B regulation protein RsbU (phosphoserine phosphatase)
VNDPRGGADLFESAACGLLRTTGDGTIVHVNAMMASWCGRPAAELCGNRFTSILTVGSRLFHQTHWMPLLQMQGSVSEVQFEVLHRDGRAIPMLVNAVARRGAPGEAIDRIDIAALVAADRRKYERELLFARRRAEELLGIVRDGERAASERALFAEELIGIVSHDLRNPLNAILLATEVLQTSELSPIAQRTVKRVASAAQRATRLIADLLDFTQARVGGGIRVERRACDLHAIAAESIDEMRLASPARRLDHVRTGEGLCNLDGDRIAQVVGNLLANAVAYGAPDAPIVLTTTLASGAALLSVHNEGSPIPPQLQASIFEPMRRGTHDAGSAARSVGLGLYIVDRIVRAHEGTVTVRSDDAEGTTFTVTLPSAQVSGPIS